MNQASMATRRNGQQPFPPEEEDMPACQSCRKRKLKCSREIPSCSQCLRLGLYYPVSWPRRFTDMSTATACVYDPKRQKPGIKTDVIEGLNKRLELLESILLDKHGKQKVLLPPTAHSHDDDFHLASPRSKEALSTSSSSNQPLEYQHDTIQDARLDSSKRRRLQDDDHGHQRFTSAFNYTDDILINSLPAAPLLETILDTYFVQIHPWIPMIHELRFRTNIEKPSELSRLAVLLHAIASVSLRHVNIGDAQVNLANKEEVIIRSRNIVLLNAMDKLSVENLQALIILAFDFMGSGQLSRAWSIIGSMTRTVEYLQLTVEPEEAGKSSLLRPFELLGKAEDFREAEERRRVFWNIFLLDRFCSVTSGWSTSLTSDDVRRKLPSEGGMWHRGEPVETPFFGIWSKSAAKIGNSIVYIPAHYPPQNERNTTTPEENSAFVDVDQSKIGALAYRIEATESLSQVTSFFLLQQVDFQSRQEVGSWLTRFKELDLRLVHWKMFLPQRWRDPNVSRDADLIKMDPNLTVAHLSHNASMILLHQHIAYPPAEWGGVLKLPSASACSAETCLLAAVEISSIVQKYLRYTEGDLVTGQFAFCVFIAARILLVHWRYYNATISPEFSNLVESLQEMSRRWKGFSEPQYLDLAGQYALHLQKLHQKSLENSNYYLEILGYLQRSASAKVGGLLPTLALSETNPSSSPTHRTNAGYGIQERSSRPAYGSSTSEAGSETGTKFLSSQLPYAVRSPAATSKQSEFSFPYEISRPNIPPQDNQMIQPEGQNDFGLVNIGVEDELSAMSHILLGQQFLEMDRVITLEGADFNLDLSNWDNSGLP